MKYSEFHCSGCDFRQSLRRSAPHELVSYCYRLPSGLSFAAETSLGWCAHCSQVTPVETLNTNSIEKWRNRLVLREQTIPQDSSLPFFVRLKERYLVRREIKGAEKMISLISLREHPKCLVCGSAMVSQIDPDIPFRHSSACSGNIAREIVDDGMFWDCDPRTVVRYYSAEGTFLFEDKR